jgi:hypothetical protein
MNVLYEKVKINKKELQMCQTFKIVFAFNSTNLPPHENVKLWYIHQYQYHICTVIFTIDLFGTMKARVHKNYN